LPGNLTVSSLYNPRGEIGLIAANDTRKLMTGNQISDITRVLAFKLPSTSCRGRG
jgi:hypothetical protein